MNRVYSVKGEMESYSPIAMLTTEKWHTLYFQLDGKKGQFSIAMDGQGIVQNWNFLNKDGVPERIVFRIGEYRLTDDVQEHKSGSEFKPGWDEPNADEKVKEAVYYVKNFKAIERECK